MKYLFSSLLFFSLTFGFQGIQAQDMDLYLLMGQSNMAGRGKPAAIDQETHPRVYMLTADHEFVPAQEPVHFDKPKIVGVGPGFSFGKAMAEANPGRTIGLIPCAVGGTSIEKWRPGAFDPATKTHPFDDMTMRTLAALKHGKLKGMIWHQGEADCSPEKMGAYLTKLAELVARVRNDFKEPDLPVVIGELGEYRQQTKGPYTFDFNRMLHDAPASIPNLAVAGAIGLTEKGDGSHFDAASAREFGLRYALQMQRLQSPSQAEYLIRSDDMGFSHASNTANLKLIETGLPFSISVIFAGPWYQETVEMLKQHPHISVGVHLCLNAEWKNYRWGPVAGKNAVPSLVDSLGYFRSEVMSRWKDIAKAEEVEIEFRAQIERALATGLRIDYLDNHMGAGMYTAEHRAIVEKLAEEYRLGISGYFGEQRAGGGLQNIAYQHQLDTLTHRISQLEPGATYLQVFHLAELTPETEVLYHNGKAPYMAWQRQNELLMLSDPLLREALMKYQVKSITYRDLIERGGLGAMRRP